MNMRPSGDDRSWEESPGTVEQIRRFGPATVIVVVALLFVLQNTEQIEFEFLWFDFEMPMWVMLVGFAGVGALVLYGVQRRLRRRASREATKEAS